MPATVLDRLGALERRYDGPMPPGAVRAALAGGAARLAEWERQHDVAATERRLRQTLAVLAGRRRAGKPGLEGWSAEVARLRGIAAGRLRRR